MTRHSPGQPLGLFFGVALDSLRVQVKNAMVALSPNAKEVRMEFRSSNVMAFIIRFCQSEEVPIHVDRTKAQKLLYCCYGAVLAATNERLTDEHPKAWPYGPVFPRTFNDIKKGRLTVDMAREFEDQCSWETLDLIKKTIRTFGRYTATQLSNWSHMKDSPWSKADSLASLDDREIALFFTRYLPIIRGEANAPV